ncbi:hypothetical protein C7M84_020649 [Penaeus vannamei]|uniref:Transmembrane protein n=1 Tax=Penaeus vannamei TaxID=6689 RepID=A0A3R7SHJ1_PENVA|nr:hypothetical protein C7M84_020649 [Penaeus vannamei]
MPYRWGSSSPITVTTRKERFPLPSLFPLPQLLSFPLSLSLAALYFSLSALIVYSLALFFSLLFSSLDSHSRPYLFSVSLSSPPVSLFSLHSLSAPSLSLSSLLLSSLSRSYTLEIFFLSFSFSFLPFFLSALLHRRSIAHLLIPPLSLSFMLSSRISVLIRASTYSLVSSNSPLSLSFLLISLCPTSSSLSPRPALPLSLSLSLALHQAFCSSSFVLYAASNSLSSHRAFTTRNVASAELYPKSSDESTRRGRDQVGSNAAETESLWSTRANLLSLPTVLAFRSQRFFDLDLPCTPQTMNQHTWHTSATPLSHFRCLAILLADHAAIYFPLARPAAMRFPHRSFLHYTILSHIYNDTHTALSLLPPIITLPLL